MPTMDLRGDMLDQPTHDDLYRIVSYMLWPGGDDDDHKRLAYREAGAKKSMVNDVRAGATPDDLASTMVWLMNSPNPYSIADQAMTRFKWGIAIGWYLYDAVAAPQDKAQDVKTRVMAKLGEFTAQTFNSEILRPMKPVAHLWAAKIWHTRDTGIQQLPTNGAQLGELLAISEWFLREGAAKRRQAQPIVDITQAWRVPPGVILPAIELRAGEPDAG